MTIFEELVKKWSSSSISFIKNIVDNDTKEFFLTLFTIKIEGKGTIIVCKDFIEIYFFIDDKMISCYFDLDYNFFNIDSVLELIMNDIDIKNPSFRDIILVKSRENKINYIIYNNNSVE
jgi:hypothetical protein